MQYEESQLSFNLLALCQSPLAQHSGSVAQRLAALQHLQEWSRLRPELSEFIPPNPFTQDPGSVPLLSEFQLSPEDVEKAEIPEAVREAVSRLSTAKEAQELYAQFSIDIKATMGEFRAELLAMAEDEQRVKGRKKDYGPALHRWVTKLAEKGVLEDLIKNSE